MKTVQYQILHRTVYHYRYPVSVSHHSAFLAPRDLPDQRRLSFHLGVKPAPLEIRERTDFFGNSWQIFSVVEDHQELEVKAESAVRIERSPLALDSLDLPVERALAHFSDPRENLEVAPFLYPSPRVPYLADAAAFARPCLPLEKPLAQGVMALVRRMREHFSYDKGSTQETTSVEEFWRLRRGVCQDFAHFMVAALRGCGLAARYVSGYLLTEPPPGQPRLEGADGSHAWVSFHIPGSGWVDVDPTNGVLCDHRHVTVAWGRDYGDVGMLRGAVLGGGDHEPVVEVTVREKE